MQNLSQQMPGRLFLISVLASLVALVLLSACGDILNFGATEAPTPTPLADVVAATPTAEPSPTPEPVGGNLTIRLAQDIPMLRPWRPGSRDEEQVIDLLYSGLVRLDTAMRPQPDLATGWESTPDGRVLTFTLREDAFWHDGQPLDAEDVSFTLERMRRLPFTSTALLADLRFIAAVSTPTEHTVVLSLTERYAPLLAELALPILPQHVLEDRDLGSLNFWDVPTGSGPFQFETRVPGQSIVLSRYDDYHHSRPLLDRVAFVGAADPTVTLQALQAETLLLAELPWEQLRSLPEEGTTLRTDTYPENGFYFLAFNLRDGRPFEDVRVRRALMLALDIPRLVESATQGRGIPIANSALPGSWADLTPLSSAVDVQRARRLLEEAGWTLPSGATIRQRDGQSFTADLFVRGDDERRLIAAQRIAEAGASIGLRITVQPVDFASGIIPRYAPPYDFDLLLGSWLNGAGAPDYGDHRYYDPDDFALFHSSQINQGVLDTRVTRNFVAFSDPDYDEQAEEGRQFYELDKRMDAYIQTQQRVERLLPYIYLWVDRIPVALNNRVLSEEGEIDLASPMYLWNVEHWYVE